MWVNTFLIPIVYNFPKIRSITQFTDVALTLSQLHTALPCKCQLYRCVYEDRKTKLSLVAYHFYTIFPCRLMCYKAPGARARKT